MLSEKLHEDVRFECETRIYSTCVHPILIYETETKADNNKADQALRVLEVSVVHAISEKTRGHRVCRQSIRHGCKIQDVVPWVYSAYVKRKYRNQHMYRMNNKGFK